MSDIVDIIHRFNYEVQGQQSLSQVQSILQQQVQTIGQNTASLKRLEQALASTTNPQLQQRLQQAIQNRRDAIANENTAIAGMLRNDTTLQNALQAEIGIINELNGRLNSLRNARDNATSVSGLAEYSRQITAIEAQRSALLAGRPTLSAPVAPIANSNVLANRATPAAIQNVRNNLPSASAIQGEIGLINQLNKKLEELRQARANALNSSEIANYNRQIQSIERQQQQFLRQGLNGGGSVFASLGQSIMQGIGIGGGMGIFGAIQSGVGFIKDFAKESFTAAANFDQLKVAFTTMLQSEPKAAKLLDDIVKFAASTPYGVQELTGLSKQLLAYGFAADEIIPTLEMLGNVAAGVGKDKMPQIILAFGQIRAAGRLMGQDLLQLVNAGFNPLQVISEKTGESMLSLRQKMEKGAISFKMVKDAFKTATGEGGKFFNLMQAQTNTVAGQIDRLEDSFQQLKIALGEVSQGAGREFIGLLSDMVEGWVDYFKVDAADKLRREQMEVNILATAIMNANDNQAVRNQLIAQMNAKYPEFLGNLKAEEVSNGLIAARLGQVNGLYREKIRLALQSAKVDQLNERIQKQAGAEVDYSMVDATLKQFGINKATGTVSKADYAKLTSEQKKQLAQTVMQGNLGSGKFRFGASIGSFFGGAELTYSEFYNVYQDMLKAQKDGKPALDALQKETEELDRQKQVVSDYTKTTLEKDRARLIDLKKSQSALAAEFGKGNANAGIDLAIVDQQVKDTEKLIRINEKLVNDEAKANAVTPEDPAAPGKKKKGPKPKTAEQLADAAYKKAVEDIETQIGNQRLIDKHLKDLRDLQLKNEQSYSSYINSAQYQTDSADVRTSRQRQYTGIGQILSAEIQKTDLTYDVAEITLKIDAATKLKRQPELIKLVEELGKKELEFAKIRVELPVEIDLNTKGALEWSSKAQKAMNDAYYKQLKDDADREKGILKDREQAYQDMYGAIMANASVMIDSIYSKQIQAYDNEIAYRQYTIQKASELALRGNTEVLEQEEASLRKATAARERAAQRQQELNAILQASNMAVALSEAIGAIVKAAAQGDPYTIAARVVAAVAALVGGVAALSSAFSSANGYKDGVIDLQGPGTTKSDSINARLSKGESVMTAEATAKYKPHLEKMNNLDFNIQEHLPSPVVYLPKPPKSVPSSEAYVSKKELSMIGKKLDEVVEAVSNIQVHANQKMDKGGLAQSVEVFIQEDKRRFK